MTIRELIDYLERYPDAMRVAVNGYEEGYDDLSPGQISIVNIALNTGVNTWEGRHRDINDVPAASAEPIQTVEAVVLRRTSR